MYIKQKILEFHFQMSPQLSGLLKSITDKVYHLIRIWAITGKIRYFYFKFFDSKSLFSDKNSLFQVADILFSLPVN